MTLYHNYEIKTETLISGMHKIFLRCLLKKKKISVILKILSEFKGPIFIMSI